MHHVQYTKDSSKHKQSNAYPFRLHSGVGEGFTLGTKMAAFILGLQNKDDTTQ